MHIHKVTRREREREKERREKEPGTVRQSSLKEL